MFIIGTVLKDFDTFWHDIRMGAWGQMVLPALVAERIVGLLPASGGPVKVWVSYRGRSVLPPPWSENGDEKIDRGAAFSPWTEEGARLAGSHL